MIICMLRGDGHPIYHRAAWADMCDYHLQCEWWWNLLVHLAPRG